MTAILESELHGLDHKIERVLYAGVNHPLRAVTLMDRAGMKFTVHEGDEGGHVIPQTAWIEFFHSLRRVERFLALHGYAVRKSGGTPFDTVWIEVAHTASPSV